MIRQSLTVENKLGIHTRAAAKLVDTAKRYSSRIELMFRDRIVDCKSIMGVITLGAQKDHQVDVIINGDDEQEALTAIRQIFHDKFGED